MLNFSTNEEKNAFELGINYTKKYVMFCIAKYPQQINLRGTMCLINDVMDFLSAKTDIIPNTEGMNFESFCEKYDFK